MTSQPEPKEPTRKRAPRKANAKKITALPTPPPTLEPLRPLGQEGRRMWERVWEMRSKWIVQDLDVDHVTMLCESVDERVGLRVKVLRDGEWRDRVALRALDEQIDRMMGSLGLNPSERARMNFAVEQSAEADPLARMRARYARDRAAD